MNMYITKSDAQFMDYHKMEIFRMHNSENYLLQQDTRNSPTHQDFGGVLQDIFSLHLLWMILWSNM